MASESSIKVYEGNDPTLVFLVSLRKTDGTVVPYPTAGRTWSFYLKAARGTTDPAPVAGSHDATQDTASASAITVALTSAQIGATGSRFYRLDVVNAGRRETVALGTFNIVDV